MSKGHDINNATNAVINDPEIRAGIGRRAGGVHDQYSHLRGKAQQSFQNRNKPTP